MATNRRAKPTRLSPRVVPGHVFMVWHHCRVRSGGLPPVCRPCSLRSRRQRQRAGALATPRRRPFLLCLGRSCYPYCSFVRFSPATPRYSVRSRHCGRGSLDLEDHVDLAVLCPVCNVGPPLFRLALEALTDTPFNVKFAYVSLILHPMSGDKQVDLAAEVVLTHPG